MDYGRSDRAELLAADYVMGTMRGHARARFETLLPAHASLRRAVDEWQQRLIPLAFCIDEVDPPAHVWTRIKQRVEASDARAALNASPPASPPASPAAAAAAMPSADVGTSRWRSLRLWRGIAAFASVAAVGFAVLLANPPPAQAPILVVLSAPAAGAAAATPGFVASLSGDGRALVTRPLTPVALQPDRALELWALPQSGAPRSLGLISADGTTALRRDRVMPDTKALAVSLEPPGGSPTGAPTGPVLYSGALTL